MKKSRINISKILAIQLILTFFFCNSMPVIANSISNIPATTEENVEFNTTIEDGYSVKADVSSELKLNLTVKVSNTGYLKDGTITLDGNNYEIVTTSNENVKSISGNKIELNQVNAGEVLSVEIPIKTNKTDLVPTDEFNKDSTVTLDATYVNEKGKEKKINKTLTEHIEWTANAVEKVSQKLVRYLKYDANKTMISFEVKDGIENNLIPVTSKEIRIVVPQINATNPSKVVVTQNNDANNTASSMNYEYKDGKLVINKKNDANSDGKIIWNSEDTYMVTYIYDATSTETEQSITTSASAKITTIKGDTVEGNTETNDYSIKAKVGSIVELEINGATEINKGYMYTNINRADNKLDTGFEVTYKANIGYAELSDKIIISEKDSRFNDENGKEILNATNNITDKKVKTTLEELTKILGEEGTITVKDSNSNVIGTLNKDTLELEVNTNLLTFETSKPQAEGNLNITVNKILNGTAVYTKDQVKSLKNMTSEVNVIDIYQNNEIANNLNTKQIKLIEPTSKSTISISTDTLSTITKNENVVINVTLNTNDIINALYTNPEIKVTLPDEVENAELLDARLLYEDELTPLSCVTNGREFIIKLQGTQTKYSVNNISKGTVLRIVANLTLNKLSPSKNSKILLEYLNRASDEYKKAEKEIKIMAPTGFITTNSINIGKDTVTSQESNENSIKINVNSKEQNAIVSANIINNSGNEINGITILGKIPSKENTTPDQKNIGMKSTFDTQIVSEINTTDSASIIYYSNKNDVNANINDANNNWSTNYDNNTKSYMIILPNTLKNEDRIDFNYKIKIPKNIDYANEAFETYAIYYNSESDSGTIANIKLAAKNSIKTDSIPVLETSIVATDYQNGNVLEDSAPIGKDITFTINIKNTGKQKAENAIVKIYRPDGYYAYITEYDEKYNEEKTKIDGITTCITKSIGDIEAGQSIQTTIRIEGAGISKLDTELELKTEVSASNVSSTTSSIKTLKIVTGDLTVKLTSTSENKILQNGEKVKYIIKVNNYSEQEIENLKITLHIPDQLECTSCEDGEYDAKDNTITYTKSNFTKNEGMGKFIELNVKEDITVQNEIQLYATAAYEGGKADIESNFIKSIVGMYSNVSAEITSNILDGNLSDTDTIEYYITVKNESYKDMRISISDIIPNELRAINYTIKNDNNVETYQTNSNSVNIIQNVRANSSLKLTISAKPGVILSQAEDVKIDNTPTVYADGISIKTNSITNTIKNTKNLSQNYYESTNNIKEGSTYNHSITGMLWQDTNYNGRQDKDEPKINSIEINLYDRNQNNIAKDKNGKELKTITDENGMYKFENLKSGKYIVIAKFDTSKYSTTNYQISGLSSNENSDFVEIELNNEKVAATDVIDITDANIYNMDLGIAETKKFDLKLESSIIKATVVNPGVDTESYNYNTNLAKVELNPDYVDEDTVIVKYIIRIINEGNIAGYAKEIVDYIPKTMTFISELNKEWYLSNDGKAYNTSLENTLIQPGETKEIEIILTKKMTGENVGLFHNLTEISKEYNENGLEDFDSISGNKAEGEDDISSSDILIGINTGKQKMQIILISLVIITIMGLGVTIAKIIIDKNDN